MRVRARVCVCVRTHTGVLERARVCVYSACVCVYSTCACERLCARAMRDYVRVRARVRMHTLTISALPFSARGCQITLRYSPRGIDPAWGR